MIARPQYGSLPVAAALDCDWSGYHLSEKMDGVWHELAIGRSIIVGELMPDGSFYAFDLAIFAGADLRREPHWARQEILDTFKLRRPEQLTLSSGERAGVRASVEPPDQFIQRILARGGEGVVAKVHDGRFGLLWIKVKRQETHDVTVAEIHPARQSVRMESEGLDRGWLTVPQSCCLRAWPATLSIGDVIEVRCHSIRAGGKFREAQLVRRRPDKILNS